GTGLERTAALLEQSMPRKGAGVGPIGVMETIPDPGATRKTIPDPMWKTPATPEEVAAALRQACDARRPIQIRGAGTKIHWGPARHVDVVLDMCGLNRV